MAGKEPRQVPRVVAACKEGHGFRFCVIRGGCSETALCFGWIDGQKKAHSEQYWLQKFTLRSDKSVWSKINKAKALALIKAGKNEVRRSQRD